MGNAGLDLGTGDVQLGFAGSVGCHGPSQNMNGCGRCIVVVLT